MGNKGLEILTQNYKKSGNFTKYRIAAYIANDFEIKQAAAATEKLAGIIGFVTGTDTHVDIYRDGFREVEYGATVTRGQLLTSDSQGRAVPAQFAAGAVVYIIGIAEVNGVEGDIGQVHIVPGQLNLVGQEIIVDVALTTAQVKALNATPITVAAAPGAGKAIVPIFGQSFMDYGSVAYDGVATGEDLALRYTNGSGTILVQFEATGFLDQTSDQMRYATPTQSGNTNLTPTANAAVVAHMTAGEIATGDSPVRIRFAYRIIDTAL